MARILNPDVDIPDAVIKFSDENKVEGFRIGYEISELVPLNEKANNIDKKKNNG